MTELDVVWVTGPRAAGKSTTAMAFSRTACAVDTDKLLAALNSRVPRKFRYRAHQSIEGFKRMAREDFKRCLVDSWDSVSELPRQNCAIVLAGWHTRYEWIREVILETIVNGQRCREHFLCVIPPVETLLTNIRRRNNEREISEFCNPKGTLNLKETIAEFNALDSQWKRVTISDDLLLEIANYLNVPCPDNPIDWIDGD